MTNREPAGSIIERFRGTEWETPPPPAPPPPPRRRSVVAMVLAAAVLISGVVGVVIILVNQGGPPSGSTFLRPPNVTPRVPDSVRIIERFWTVVRDPKLTYHLEGHGMSATADLEESFTVSLDVAGDDYAGTLNTIGGSGQAELIRLDGVMYVRPAGQDWIIARTSDASLRQDPFMGLAGRRELEYDAALVENGATVHRLVSTTFYAPSVSRMLDIAAFGLHPDSRTLELIVSDDGVPLRATFNCVVDGSLVDGIPHFEGTATYEFSGFGEPVVIASPSPVDLATPAP